MNINAEVYDSLFRSRKTLLNILSKKGYVITPYEKFGPWEIESMIISDKKNALRMDLTKENDTAETKITKCVVLYYLNRLKQRVTGLIENFFKEDSEEYIADPETTEVIVIVLEPVNKVDIFHNAAFIALNKKLHLSFFQAQSLVNNPQDHILVPKHELVPKDDITELKKKLNIQSVNNLPIIRFHQDIQSRILGAIPGDVIKITRPSPSAGIELIYRVCVP